MTEPLEAIHIPWPPTLADLKVDMKIVVGETRDDATLSYDLNAAYDFVSNRKRGKYKFDATDPDQFELPDPPHDFRLGVLRLAARLSERRRSKDGMINMQELGVARIAGSDPDIDRMLQLGKFLPMQESFA